MLPAGNQRYAWHARFMDAEELAALWRERLESWAIPEEILAAAPADPWSYPLARFTVRTDRALAEPDDGPTLTRLSEGLPDGGTLLDVGSGPGASSLPLRERIGHLYAVDLSEEMLEELAGRADKLGVPVTTIAGRWPDVADQVPRVDAT